MIDLLKEKVFAPSDGKATRSDLVPAISGSIPADSG